MDVADFAINYAATLDNPLSNLHLQKTLYFLNVIHLLETEKPLIDDEHFERWHYGPVLPNVYSEYSVNGSNFIDKPKSHDYMFFDEQNNLKSETHNFDSADISPGDKNFIKSHIPYFLNASPFNLVDYSHQETQWKDQPLSAEYRDERSISFYSDPKNRFWEQE